MHARVKAVLKEKEAPTFYAVATKEAAERRWFQLLGGECFRKRS